MPLRWFATSLTSTRFTPARETRGGHQSIVAFLNRSIVVGAVWFPEGRVEKCLVSYIPDIGIATGSRAMYPPLETYTQHGLEPKNESLPDFFPGHCHSRRRDV